MSETNAGAPKDMRELDLKLTRQWIGLRMAHEATMLEDLRGLLASQREQLAAHQRLMTATPPEAPMTPDDEDTGIHVGDVNETHYHAAPSKPESPLPAFMTSPVGSMVGKALGYGLPAAGLLYAGTLLGGKQEPAPAPVQVKPLEFDLKWRIVDGKMQQEVVPVPENKP